MRYTLKCAAVGLPVLVGGLAMTAPARASEFWNLKAELENAGADQYMCMGISGGPWTSPETDEPAVNAATQIIVWDCNDNQDQTWNRTPDTVPAWQYHPPEWIRDAVNDQFGNPMCLSTWGGRDTGPNLYAGYCEPTYPGPSDGIDYDFTYVQDDPMGFPCFRIQDHYSGLYVGVADAQDPNPIQNGMAVILWDRTSSNDQVWCDHAPPNVQTGTAIPSYIVLNVAYAPPGAGSAPGKGSTMTYQNTTSVGTTVTTTSTDSAEVNFSAGVSASGSGTSGGVPISAGGGVTVTTSDGQSTTDTDETDVTMSWTNSWPVLGTSDAIDHDYDQIWILINPLMIGTYTPLYPSIDGQAGSGEPADVNWRFGQGDESTTDVTMMVLAGMLNGHIAWDNTINSLHQYGIYPDADPTVAQALLWADPLFNADGVDGIAPVENADSARFQEIDEFDWAPSIPSPQSLKLDQKTTSSTSTKSTYSYSVSVKVSASFQFLFSFSASETSKWSWSHSSSTKSTSIQEVADTLSLVSPQPNYAGPGFLHVYEDMMFNTYAFSLDEGPPPSSFYDGGTQCVAGGVSMHCCPAGNAMVGARLDNNVFKCAPLANASAPIVADYGTQRSFPTSPSGNPVTLHSCPFGSVMVGLRADMDILLCQQMPTKSAGFTWDAITTERIDDNTSDTQDAAAAGQLGYSMHACETGVGSQAMSGINAASNIFNCAMNPGFAN
jgi:hypothetical protein